MIERDGPLSLSRQCALLGVSRSSQYYRPKGESAEDLALMRRMDELHMAYPFYGSRQLMRHLRREGVAAGRHRIRRLMRLMGMEATYRRPRTSVASPEHRVFPYLLRGRTISRADHVWCADITYVPVTQGFFYLVAVMDWATRHVLAWRLSNTMDASFCVQALDDALGWRAPEILNTDQGSQFTSEAFADRVLGAGVRFSMDGRGRFLDNIFIERLWRSLKYEAVYLYELRDGPDAQRIIGSWIDFYNKYDSMIANIVPCGPIVFRKACYYNVIRRIRAVFTGSLLCRYVPYRTIVYPSICDTQVGYSTCVNDPLRPPSWHE